MISREKLLQDLQASEKNSIEEKVCIDIFMNIPEYNNDINFIRAFHGPIIRDDVVMILQTDILNKHKEDIRKSLRKTIPGYLAKIKIALDNFKKIKK